MCKRYYDPEYGEYGEEDCIACIKLESKIDDMKDQLKLVLQHMQNAKLKFNNEDEYDNFVNELDQLCYYLKVSIPENLQFELDKAA